MARNKNTNQPLLTCKKEHDHFVCWVPLGKKKRLTVFKLWFVPNRLNQHTPQIIRARGLALVLLLLLSLQLVYNVQIANKPQILGYANNVSASQIVKEVNISREKEGLPALKVSESLQYSAALKASDMFENNYWSHDAPNGTQPWHWFQEAGYTYQYAGENLAKDFNTSNGVTKAWLNSPTHRDNMLNTQYQEVGIAAVNGLLGNDKTTLVVAHFGTKQQDGSVAGVITSAANTSGDSIFTNTARINAITNPISLVTLSLLISVFTIAVLTHWHYIKLPRKVRKSWYKHHAFYTAMFSIFAIVYLVYILTAGTI